VYHAFPTFKVFDDDKQFDDIAYGSIFSDLMHTLRHQASPGYEARVTDIGPDIATVLENHHDEILEYAVYKVKALWKLYLAGVVPTDPRDVMWYGLRGCAVYFVKGEPHSHKKIVERRVRLIAIHNLADQLVDRLFHYMQNTLEQEYWAYEPTSCGISFTHEGWERLYSEVSPLGDRVVATDMSGWDVSLMPHFFDIDADVRIRLSGLDEQSFFAYGTRAVARYAKRILYVDSQGYIFSPKPEGPQSSGLFSTASGNSRMRAAAYYLVALQLNIPMGKVWTMGDDCLEEIPEEVPLSAVVEAYASLGLKVKGTPVRGGEDFEFCSHRYTANGCYLLTLPKMVYAYLSKKYIDADHQREAYDSILSEMTGSPDRATAIAVIRACGGTPENNST
jgi:hypothetical protein